LIGVEEANGAVITDSLPVFEWNLTRPLNNNAHFRLEIDTDSTFGDTNGQLRTFESKEDPAGFEYSMDNGRTWLKFSKTGVPPGITRFRFVFSKNLEVV